VALSHLEHHALALAAWEDVLRLPDNATLNMHGRTVRVLTDDFRRAQARLARATCLAQLGRAEALAAFRAVFAIDADSPHRPLTPSAVHTALRTLEVARTAFHQHIAAHANDVNTWRRAGSDWLAAQRPGEAIAAYDTLVRLAPTDPHAWFGKAEAHAQAEQLEASEAAYKKALELWPEFLGAAARLKVIQGRRSARG
jgi:tetratricopeptide (TPR) repeat protein